MLYQKVYIRNLTDFCKKVETDVDPRLRSNVAYSDLHVGEGGYLRNKSTKLIMCPLFLRRLRQEKILSPIVFSIFLGPTYFRIFFHLLYFGIFFVSCSKGGVCVGGGVARHLIHPPPTHTHTHPCIRPWLNKCLCA